MSGDDFIDAANARLEEFRRRELRNMARQILGDIRGISFSITMLGILLRTIDDEYRPTIVEGRRIVNAFARWQLAGARQARRAG